MRTAILYFVTISAVAVGSASTAIAQSINPTTCLSAKEHAELLDELGAALGPFGGFDIAPMATRMREIAATLPRDQQKLAECRASLFGQCSADEFRVKSAESEFERLNQFFKLRNSITISVRNKYRLC